MTTIVYRAGVMAADSRAYSGSSSPIGTKVKVHKLDDGTLVGFSTNNVGGDAMLLRWVMAGCPVPESGDVKPDSFTLLMVNPIGQVFLADGNLDLSGPLAGEYFAIGTGRKYALAAFYMGASAEEAVEVAKAFDIWSGGPVSKVSR